MLVYAADGYLYKTWNGPTPITEEETDLDLGPGIKLFDWNKTGTHLAIGDYSERVTVLSTPAFTESMNLIHTASVKPSECVQVLNDPSNMITPLTTRRSGRNRSHLP